MITRREAIVMGMAAAMMSTNSVAAKLLFASYGLPIGINLYMLDDFYRKDLNGALEAVANIGYSEIETSLENHAAADIKEALHRYGLRCSNIGILPKPFRGGMSLQTDAGILAENAHIVGAEYITLDLFPIPDGVEMRPLANENIEQMLARVANSVTTDDWKRNAALLNETGARLQKYGIKFAYHNHNAEFAPHGETNGLAILLEHTDPKLVHFHMDAGWVVAAGHDPVEILNAYPNRFRLMHVKDVAATHQLNTTMQVATTEVGSGIIDWRRTLNAAIAQGVKHFAVEQEPPYAMPRIDSARKSFNYLKSLEVG